MAKIKRAMKHGVRQVAKPKGAVTLAQPRADLWEDRDGNARPTPERMTHAAFTLHDTEDAGARCAVAIDDYLLDKLCAKGLITADQKSAGWDYARLHASNRLTSSGRSCLDFSPVGYDASLPDDPGKAQEWHELYLCLGVAFNDECRRVCVDHRKPRDLSTLRAALDICVKFFKR